MAVITFKKLSSLLVLSYCAFTIYSTCSLWMSHNIGENVEKIKHIKLSLDPPKGAQEPKNNNVHIEKPILKNVEIWGKAAIGEYLWSHIIEGIKHLEKDGISKVGTKVLQGFNFTYRTGYSVTTSTVPHNSKFVVLIVNGMSEEKKITAKSWLDELCSQSFASVKKLIVIMLGDEKCNNNWMLPYMKSNGGPISVAFLVYDSPLINNKEFYQWPLGVATYREFPLFTEEELDIITPRPYICNFLGTAYKNSSRETLINVIKKNNMEDICFLKSRDKWSPTESPETLGEYVQIVSDSDLTLSPVGQNTECYRIYEALSLGSVPVVEDIITIGQCDNSTNSPLRLLKSYGAPLIYIKSWETDLPVIIQREKSLTIEEKVARRATIMNWYKNFRLKMADRFITVLKSTFVE